MNRELSLPPYSLCRRPHTRRWFRRPRHDGVLMAGIDSVNMTRASITVAGIFCVVRIGLIARWSAMTELKPARPACSRNVCDIRITDFFFHTLQCQQLNRSEGQVRMKMKGSQQRQNGVFLFVSFSKHYIILLELKV